MKKHWIGLFGALVLAVCGHLSSRGFSLLLNPSSLSLPPGSSAQTTLTLNPQGGFRAASQGLRRAIGFLKSVEGFGIEGAILSEVRS